MRTKKKKYYGFLNDADKMKDFFISSRKNFLEYYSYLKEEDYNETIKQILLRIADRM
jgi:hypothetical protein